LAALFCDDQQIALSFAPLLFVGFVFSPLAVSLDDRPHSVRCPFDRLPHRLEDQAGVDRRGPRVLVSKGFPDQQFGRSICSLLRTERASQIVQSHVLESSGFENRRDRLPRVGSVRLPALAEFSGRGRRSSRFWGFAWGYAHRQLGSINREPHQQRKKAVLAGIFHDKRSPWADVQTTSNGFYLSLTTKCLKPQKGFVSKIICYTSGHPKAAHQ